MNYKIVLPNHSLIGYHMAQPEEIAAHDNDTDRRISIFWASASLDPPWQFTTWLEKFLLEVTVKQIVNPEIMLEDSKDILEEPPK